MKHKNIEKTSTATLENYIHNFSKRDCYWSDVTLDEVVRELKRHGSTLSDDEAFKQFCCTKQRNHWNKTVTFNAENAEASPLKCRFCGTEKTT